MTEKPKPAAGWNTIRMDLPNESSSCIDNPSSSAILAPEEEEKLAGGLIVSPSDPSVRKPFAHSEAIYALATGICYMLLYRISMQLPYSLTTVVAVTLLSFCAVLLFTVRVARAERSVIALGVSLCIAGICALPLVLVRIAPGLFAGAGWGGFFRLYGRMLAVPGLYGLLLIWFAASVGALLSKVVREVKMLLPMSLVLACVDLYVVFGGGLVTQATQGTSPVAAHAMRALTVSLPTVRTSTGAAPMQSMAGFADFMFIALFFACFAKFSVPSRRTFFALCAVLCGYMLIVMYTQTSLPALMPIAVVVIGMNLRQFRFERSEAFAMLYAGLLVAAILGGFWFMGSRRQETTKSRSSGVNTAKPAVK